MEAEPTVDLAVEEAPETVSDHLEVAYNLMMELLSDPHLLSHGTRGLQRRAELPGPIRHLLQRHSHRPDRSLTFIIDPYQSRKVLTVSMTKVLPTMMGLMIKLQLLHLTLQAWYQDAKV